MRISDGSSDVCSSDLPQRPVQPDGGVEPREAGPDQRVLGAQDAALRVQDGQQVDGAGAVLVLGQPVRLARLLGGAGLRFLDRKSVVEGKGVSVRVDLGDRRKIKKKKKQPHTAT